MVVLLGLTLLGRPSREGSTSGRLQPTTWAFLVLGGGAVAAYLLLSALGVGKIGAPTDIGGGLIPLVGYVLTGIGIFKAVNDRCHPM